MQCFVKNKDVCDWLGNFKIQWKTGKVVIFPSTTRQCIFWENPGVGYISMYHPIILVYSNKYGSL